MDSKFIPPEEMFLLKAWLLLINSHDAVVCLQCRGMVAATHRDTDYMDRHEFTTRGTWKVVPN
jgi:hypothetical protein